MLRRPLLFLLLLGLGRLVQAEGWPSDYVVREGSESPDGRYGMLVPPNNDDADPENAPNYFADLKNHRVLGRIEGVDYFDHQNHAGLTVTWERSGRFAVAEYDSRFGFNALIVLQPKGDEVTQEEIGPAIQKPLEMVTAKADPKFSDAYGCDASIYLRIGVDGKIRVRALSTTNPKSLDEVPTHEALFQGTYDVGRKKWMVTDAREISSSVAEQLYTAYAGLDGNTTYGSDQSEAEAYDGMLNDVYNAARFILPKAQFAKVKTDQVEWLKRRDAIASLPEQNAFVKARIKALQDSLW